MITLSQKNIFIVLATTLSLAMLWSFFFSPIRVDAQMQMPETDAPQLELEPRYPQGGQQFTVRLGDYGGALGGGTPSWYVDGELVTVDTDATTITLIAPPVGTPITIEARVGGARVWKAFTPSEIDIITESNTLAPYFYEGRRAPTLGAPVRLTAIPHLYDTKGIKVPASEITYTWNIDNKNVSVGGGPVLYTTVSGMGSQLILLTATALNYDVEYKTVFYVENTEPSLHFYILNPLTGLSRNAITDAYVRAQDEITVRAEPYGLASDVFNRARYGWSVNGSAIQNTDTDAGRITLRKQGEGGVSDIAFSIRNLSELSQYAQNLFQLEF